MREAVKGALLSGAVFPGLGQVFLKQYLRGVGLMLAVFVALIGIVKAALEQALAILEKLEWEGGEVDVAAISDAAARSVTASGSAALKGLFLLLVCCWVFGTVDAYRLGRKKDREERLTGLRTE